MEIDCPSLHWLATCYPLFLSPFLVIGFAIIKNKSQRCLIHIGMIPWSICASLSLSMILREVWILTYEVALELFCKAWGSLRNDILFLRQNPANHLAEIWKVSTCSGYVLLMICFACVWNQHFLIHLPSFLVLINLFYITFVHYWKHYFPLPCWSWRPFLFLYQLFTFHPVSFLLSIFFKFIRSLTVIFPIIILIYQNNGFLRIFPNILHEAYKKQFIHIYSH